MISIENFADRLCDAVKKKKSILCVGLDPQLKYMPPHLIRKAANGSSQLAWLLYDFNRQIIHAIADIAVCVKPNMAFYECYGHDGVLAFERTVACAEEEGLLVIGDVKRGDGGDTAEAYANGYIGKVPFFGADDPTALTLRRSPASVDAITINGYIGEACVAPFIKVAKENGAGIFVVAKTSFKPNSVIEQLRTDGLYHVWQELAGMVQLWGAETEGSSGIRNVGVVMGATYPTDAPSMRKILPNSIFLIPGFGGQGATADDAVVGIRSDGLGGIVNDSRSILYAWQDPKGHFRCESEKFAEAARSRAIEARDQLVAACKKADKWPF